MFSNKTHRLHSFSSVKVQRDVDLIRKKKINKKINKTGTLFPEKGGGLGGEKGKRGKCSLNDLTKTYTNLPYLIVGNLAGKVVME